MSRRRLTILIEHPGSLVLLDHREQLETAGYEVVTCRGPRSLPDGTCPLVTSGDCPLAARADVIVNALGSRELRVYAAERARLPDVPVCLALDHNERERLGGLLKDTLVISPTSGGNELVRAVEAALETRKEDEDTDR